MGVLREFVSFLAANKKWWLVPAVLSVLAMGVLLLLGKGGKMPFLYLLY